MRCHTFLMVDVVNPNRRPGRPMAVPWDEYSGDVTTRYRDLLGTNPDEPSMQRFFEHHPSLLPGAGEIGKGGHHGAWWEAVISQPKLQGLPPKRVPDFMFVRSDTATTRPICIEIEAPVKPWFNKDLTPTAKLTQALDQLDEWAQWFSKIENHPIFNRLYVPEEWDNKPIEPVFVLIYGRTGEFCRGGPHRNFSRARSKRDRLRPDYYIYTYDMLKPSIDGEHHATLQGDQISGFNLLSLPAIFGTSSHLTHPGSLMAAVDNIKACLERNPAISKNRRLYLEERWEFWSAQRKAEQEGNLSIHSFGYE